MPQDMDTAFRKNAGKRADNLVISIYFILPYPLIFRHM